MIGGVNVVSMLSCGTIIPAILLRWEIMKLRHLRLQLPQWPGQQLMKMAQFYYLPRNISAISKITL